MSLHRALQKGNSGCLARSYVVGALHVGHLDGLISGWLMLNPVLLTLVMILSIRDGYWQLSLENIDVVYRRPV